MVSESSLSENVESPEKQQDLINFISKIVEKISQTKNEVSILETGVEIIYQALKCDRVIIYTLAPDSSAKVVAEAFTPGFAQILGTTIDNPYFRAEYIDKYQKGRVKIINDIYQASINPFYLKNLEKIDVKANVVLPLVNLDGSLYGLLIAHQCSRSRIWEKSEINLMLQVSDWIMAQVARYSQFQILEDKLDNFNNWQDSLIEITQKIYAATNTLDVLHTAVSKARDVLKCDRIVVYSLQEPTFGQIIAESSMSALAPILGRTITDPCFKHHYLEKYQEGRVRAINNIYEAGMTSCYIENLEKIGVRSNLVVPINSDEGRIYGLLVAHQCFAFREWQEREIWWIEQVAYQTGFSLSKAQLEDKAKSLDSDLDNLETSRDIITIATSQVKEVQKPIQIISQNLLETLNLNRLLAREINLINKSGSMQSKRETNLIQIISKKLYINITELKKSFDLLDEKNQEMEQLLENTATHLYHELEDTN